MVPRALLGVTLRQDPPPTILQRFRQCEAPAEEPSPPSPLSSFFLVVAGNLPTSTPS